MSGKTGIIIQARMSSTRLPGKTLKPIGGRPLIFYVLNRLKLLGMTMCVCTSEDPSDDILCRYLSQQNIDYFRGDLLNVLERYIGAAEKFNIEHIIRVTADNPFVDIKFLKDCLPLIGKYKYVDGIYPGGLIKGTGFEFVELTELKEISSQEENHLEHVTSWLRENMEESTERIKLIPNQFNKYRKDVILTCDFQKDFELIEAILGHFDYRSDISIEEIIEHLGKTPAHLKINSTQH